MPISRGDRFKLLCHIGKIFEFDDFKEVFWKQQKQHQEKPTKLQTLRRNFERWCQGYAFHQANEEFIMSSLVDKGWPNGVPKPDQLLEKEESVTGFLDVCKLSYSEVEYLLSAESKSEWSEGHHRLHFMKALDDQSVRPRAKLLLPKLVGTYRLYRRHSVLPGLLREHFIIDEHKEGHCEGKYIQFARAHEPNIIPFNVFFCEFYVIAFGAHQAVGRRTEIVTVSVLIENAFSNRALLPCDDNNKFFIGLLTGIYDYGNVLLAERILIEKIDEKILIEKKTGSDGELRIAEWAPLHLHRDATAAPLGEYDRVIAVIDNSLDGQTLTARSDRLELVLT